ncbi:MAG: hypothetical protein PVF70_08510 [Anaerolineales bacterium]
MRLFKVLIAILLATLVCLLPGNALAGGGRGRNEIVTYFEPGCMAAIVESSGAPIHSIVVTFADGTRGIRVDLGGSFTYAFSLQEEMPIRSIHVKIHNEKYAGPGLGPVFKCEAESPF